MIADEESARWINIVGALRAAFEDANTKGVILRINSPGGSPVQSAISMTRFAACAASTRPSRSGAGDHRSGASGAYYIASAADEIYADKSSLVGLESE